MSVLLVADVGAPTGFARVSKVIGESIHRDCNLVQLATNYNGDPHDLNCPVFSANAKGGDDYGIHRVRELCERVQPHTVILYNDLRVLTEYVREIRRSNVDPRIVVYCPFDGGPITPKHAEALSDVHEFVVCSSFAGREVEAAFERRRRSNRVLRMPAVRIIHHPIDTQSFFPMKSQGEDRSRLEPRKLVLGNFGTDRDIEDLFIVLNANRNQGRKRIDLTLEAFAMFAENKPDSVKLYLHMGTEDLGWNLFELAALFGIEKRILLTSGSPHQPAVGGEHLNAIYNSCEVSINTSSSEGWGLVAFEHAATGGVPVMGKHTANSALWDETNAVLVPMNLRFLVPGIHSFGWTCGPEPVAEALEKLYQDRRYLQSLSSKALARATDPELLPAQIGKRWKDLILEEERVRLYV